MHSDEPVTLVIDMEGPCEVKAGDIQCGPEIEIVNKDLHIATVEENGKFYMELDMVKGRGYVSAEKNKKDNLRIGEIPIDSIFTPVKKVNFKVENTRVGQVADFDKLTLEVWTDGTIKPDDATSLGAKIISEHLNLFITLTDHVSDVEIMVEKEEDKKEKVLELFLVFCPLTGKPLLCLRPL